MDVLTAERPTWRGLFHAWAFWLAIPAGVLLIVFADRPSARTAAAIYAATLLLVFGTSSAYHRLAKTYRARRIMQRLDHSMIYLLIAGTYVPICLVALPGGWGVSVLSVVGGLGLLGVILKCWRLAPRPMVELRALPDHGLGRRHRRPGADRPSHPVAAGPDPRRWCGLHGRLPGAHAAPARSVADGVRLSRDLARVHRARRRRCTSEPSRCSLHDPGRRPAVGAAVRHLRRRRLERSQSAGPGRRLDLARRADGGWTVAAVQPADAA